MWDLVTLEGQSAQSWSNQLVPSQVGLPRHSSTPRGMQDLGRNSVGSAEKSTEFATGQRILELDLFAFVRGSEPGSFTLPRYVFNANFHTSQHTGGLRAPGLVNSRSRARLQGESRAVAPEHLTAAQRYRACPRRGACPSRSRTPGSLPSASTQRASR